MYVYIIEYDGKLSLEGYKDIDKAIERLKNQEYIQEYGLISLSIMRTLSRILRLII